MTTILASHVGRIFHVRLRGGNAQITAAGNDKDIITIPFKAKILAVYAHMRAIGGTAAPTFNIMLENGATNILSAVIALIAALTPLEGTLTAAGVDVAAGDILHLDVDSVTGTSPTMDDLSVDIFFQRV